MHLEYRFISFLPFSGANEISIVSIFTFGQDKFNFYHFIDLIHYFTNLWLHMSRMHLE